MTIRLKVIDRTRTIMVHMRVKRQHQRWTLPYDPHAGVAMTMDPAFVAFGTFEPTLQVHIVGRKLSRLAPHKQPQCKAAHPLGTMLLNGIRAGLPFLLQRVELRLTLRARGRGARPEGTIHCLQGLGVEANVRQRIPCDIESAVNATGQTFQQRLCRPPFWACRLRSSDSRTSCNASLIRKPGG